MYFTVQQAAERLGVSTKTIFRRIKSGDISIMRDGPKLIRISDESLQAYIIKHNPAESGGSRN